MQAASNPADWKLIWNDEFEGTGIDPAKWDYDEGNGFYSYEASQWISGWGNDEQQYYTRDPANSFVDNGQLHLRALRQSLHQCGYTSARLKSRKADGSELFAHEGGRYEFRAKLPQGQGIWPALWMLPQNEKYGRWAASGEIDVLEVRGHQTDRAIGTIHFGGTWPANASTSGEYQFPTGESTTDFHIYALEWDPGLLRWSVDGHVFNEQKFWWSRGQPAVASGNEALGKPANSGALGAAGENAWPAPFDQPYYIVMNLAVGGQFPGKPALDTPFPAEMLVDYVRVFERTRPLKLQPRGPGDIPAAK